MEQAQFTPTKHLIWIAYSNFPMTTFYLYISVPILTDWEIENNTSHSTKVKKTPLSENKSYYSQLIEYWVSLKINYCYFEDFWQTNKMMCTEHIQGKQRIKDSRINIFTGIVTLPMKWTNNLNYSIVFYTTDS